MHQECVTLYWAITGYFYIYKLCGMRMMEEVSHMPTWQSTMSIELDLLNKATFNGPSRPIFLFLHRFTQKIMLF